MKPPPGSTTLAKPYVVFSDDWGEHPSSSQHIVRQISLDHRVAWVNTVGMRRPKLNLIDLRKGMRKLSGMGRRTSVQVTDIPHPEFAVHRPTMIPYNTVAAIRRFNCMSAQRTLKRLRVQFADTRPIVLTTVPNSCDYVDAIPTEKIVYYCVDDFSEWPGLDKSLVLEMEAALIEKADTLVATSPKLYEKLAASGKPTFLLTHGVDIEHFSGEAAVELPDLNGISSPRIGYFGLFDDRSDKELIENLARRMPQVSIVVAGRVETDVDRLKRLPNLHFTGNVPYALLPCLIKGLDLLFIPYQVNALSESLSPLKLKEYLATGLPVISTPIDAVREFSDCIETASSVDEWCDKVATLLNGRRAGRRGAMVKRLAGEGWPEKAKIMNAICHGWVGEGASTLSR